ncbi:MAG: hypothetical protein ACXW1F_08390 [Halobacteriota archaeon]
MGNWLDDHEAKKKREEEEERAKTAKRNRDAQIHREKQDAIYARITPIIEPILDQFEPHIERANKSGFFMTTERRKGSRSIIIRSHKKRYKGTEHEMGATKSAHIHGVENGFSLYFYVGDIRCRLIESSKRYDEQIYGPNCHKPCNSIDGVPFNSMQEQEILNILQWLATPDQFVLPRLRKTKKWLGLFG